MPFRLRLPRTFHDRMIAHARSELPNECCGLLAGRVVPDAPATPLGVVEAIYPLVNELASPVEYRSAPRSMFDAVRDMREKRLDILAVYHSHPTSRPVPSRKDLDQSFGPGIVNLIISLADHPPTVAAWWFRDAAFVAAPFDLTGP